MAEELLPAGAPRGTAVTPDALAAVAVSLVKGVAVQVMIDPDQVDTGRNLVAVQRLIERLAPTPSENRASSGRSAFQP